MHKGVILLLLTFVIVITRWSDLSLTMRVNRANLELVPIWEQIVMAKREVLVCDPGVNMSFDSIDYSPIEKASIEDNLGVMVLLARLRWLDGMCHDALDILDRAVKMNSHAAAVLLIRYGERSDFPHSIANKLSEYAYLHALKAQRNKDSLNHITEWLEISYKLRPQFKTAERLSGIYLYELGSKEDAIRIWRTLVSELPANDPERWWAAGQVAELEGKWLDAAICYGQGVPLSRKPERFVTRLQYALEQAGRE